MLLTHIQEAPFPEYQLKNNKKKRGSLLLRLVPRVEAFALPTLSERATQKPTLICTAPKGSFIFRHGKQSCPKGIS